MYLNMHFTYIASWIWVWASLMCGMIVFDLLCSQNLDKLYFSYVSLNRNSARLNRSITTKTWYGLENNIAVNLSFCFRFLTFIVSEIQCSQKSVFCIIRKLENCAPFLFCLKIMTLIVAWIWGLQKLDGWTDSCRIKKLETSFI